MTHIHIEPVTESDSSELWVLPSQKGRWFKLKGDASELVFNPRDFATYAESLIREYGFEAVELRKFNIQTMFRKG